MVAKVLTGCRIYAVNPRSWANKKWTKEMVEKWVKTAGGVLQKEFDEHDTTHLVVEEQAWKNKIRAVQLALEASENGRKVHIVSPEWLDHCLTGQKKCREKEYLWEKLEQDAAAAEKQIKRGRQAGEGESEEDGELVRRSHQAMLGEVLQEGTEDYVGDHDRRAYEAELARIQQVEREQQEKEARRKEQEKQATEQERRAHAKEMKRTAKGGRGAEFMEKYHVFKDGTGFEYDITLTKVDTLTNRNERITLTLYESKESTRKPPKYATNMHFAGTGRQPKNNIIAALDSNYLTAMRMWRNAFQEKTGVNWDDRIKAHNERVRDRARDGETPGLFSTRRGDNGDIKSKTRAAEDAVPFEKRKFEYMPPLHAARGYLPSGKEEVPEVLRQIRAKPNEHRERTEQWMMSGGNGGGPEAPPLSPRESIEDTQVPTQIDLTADDSDDDSDASISTGSDKEFAGDMTGVGGDAAEATATEGDGVFSNMNNTGAFDAASFFVDTSAQDDVFDVEGLVGQQQEHFVFDQDQNGFSFEGDLSATEAAPTADGADFQATMLGDAASGNYASLPNQTQLAAMVGENLLNLKEGSDKAAVSGLVVVPEAEQLEAAAGVEKRKRDDDDDDEMEPAAKRFESEESESEESTT